VTGPAPAADDLRYPIGKYCPTASVGWAERDAWITELQKLPVNLCNAVEGLSDAQLDTPYRPGGWTIRQLVHHVADGHLNSSIRFRLALTEETPTIKPFEVDEWAELPDAKSSPIEPSLGMTEALHGRWVMLLRSVPDEDFKRSYVHPSGELVTLDRALSYFAWHSRHHVAQILSVRNRQGW
jgi:uncharacterized damage-inducible protein DinB